MQAGEHKNRKDSFIEIMKNQILSGEPVQLPKF